jgi:hypothetical protein
LFELAKGSFVIANLSEDENIRGVIEKEVLY